MNIVVASLDGVRPDYLTSDFFSRVKAEGSDYTNCISQASHTSTSHSSILTGMNPFTHGVRWLVDYSVQKTMIQEVLKDKGWSTAAFIGGFPLTEGDLDKGFNTYDYSDVIEDVMEGRESYMPANVIAQKAINWFNDNTEPDSFAFLHFFDAHLMLRSEFGKGEWPSKGSDGVFKDVDKYIGRRQRRYIEEVDFIGKQLELLLDLADIDLLVLTADHGTKMQGDKNYPWVYNSKGEKVGTQFHVAELYDVQLKVPLIFWGKDFNSEIIDNQVRTIDIVPTIMDLLGHSDYDCDGCSLVKREYPKYAYSETFFAQLVDANRRASELHEKSSWGWKDIDSLVSIRSAEYKLICTANGTLAPYQLFNLKKDPSEETNLLDVEIEVRDQMYGELVKMIGSDKQMETGSAVLVDELVSKLETLGYL